MVRCGKCAALHEGVAQVRQCYSALPDASYTEQGNTVTIENRGDNYYLGAHNVSLHDMMKANIEAAKAVQRGEAEGYQRPVNGHKVATKVEGEVTHSFESEGPTQPQKQFILDLWESRGVANDDQIMPTSKRDAGNLITDLLKLPKLSQFRDPTARNDEIVGYETTRSKQNRAEIDLMVPDGYYALSVVDFEIESANDWVFLKVKNGNYKVFLDMEVSDEYVPVRAHDRRMMFLKAILSDPAKASLDYGKQTTHCGVCGRKLTNDESRARGIGPQCAAKMGW